jgi:hypothetical protein
LNEPAPYTLSLEGQVGEEADVVLNGAKLGRLLLGADGRGSLLVAAIDILPGVNQIVLRPAREALSISRITLTRPGER